MPWRLVAREATLVTLHWVELERARGFVPPEIRIASFLPGRTIGGLFVAEYGPGSDLQYNELIAAAATVWHGGKSCAWVTHLYVDSHESVAGGRDLLGAPKHFARFTRASDGADQVVVGEPSRPICRVRFGRRLWLWKQRLRVIGLERPTPG
jgi:acetoacetate decarboxylase